MIACIVLPTYNEAGNITRALDLIGKNAPGVHVLVVDDNSPDGTGQIAEEYASKHTFVKVLHRKGKEGLGAAYMAGMQHALQEGYDVIFEMDADLSHDPKDIPRLLKAIEQGADLAIGSRYIDGGSIPENWGFYRKLNSAVANGLVRGVLSLKIKDCTGGFRAIRASYLEHVDFSKLNTKGYAFQISLLNALSQLGANIVEIPIHFNDRTIGASKMRLKDQLEFVITTFRIRSARATVQRSATTNAIAARKVRKL